MEVRTVAPPSGHVHETFDGAQRFDKLKVGHSIVVGFQPSVCRQWWTWARTSMPVILIVSSRHPGISTPEGGSRATRYPDALRDGWVSAKSWAEIRARKVDLDGCGKTDGHTALSVLYSVRKGASPRT